MRRMIILKDFSGFKNPVGDCPIMNPTMARSVKGGGGAGINLLYKYIYIYIILYYIIFIYIYSQLSGIDLNYSNS